MPQLAPPTPYLYTQPFLAGASFLLNQTVILPVHFFILLILARLFFSLLLRYQALIFIFTLIFPFFFSFIQIWFSHHRFSLILVEPFHFVIINSDRLVLRIRFNKHFYILSRCLQSNHLHIPSFQRSHQVFHLTIFDHLFDRVKTQRFLQIITIVLMILLTLIIPVLILTGKIKLYPCLILFLFPICKLFVHRPAI